MSAPRVEDDVGNRQRCKDIIMGPKPKQALDNNLLKISVETGTKKYIVFGKWES